MAVTIHDVARKAGVGVGTVSRVLNNSPLVSPTTRERVLIAVAELGYQPNPSARRLALGRTHTIGIISPYFTLPSFVARLNGIQAELTPTEYDLVLFGVNTPEKRDEYLSSAAKFKQVDGMIILSLGVRDTEAEAFAAWGIPVVLVDNYHPQLPCVVIDDERGGQLATEHLIALGHRRIAFISSRLENPFLFITNRIRFRGYQKALAAANIPFNPAYQRQGGHDRAAAYQMTLELLALPEPPTAIFASSDTHALGAMEAIHSKGLRIPDDISVIGYDDIEAAAYLNLTTIRQPMYRSGQEAVWLLLDLITGDAPDETTITLPVELVQRGTTAPPCD